MIPQKLHIIWLGDDEERASRNVETWVQHNPDWEITVWSHADLRERAWMNATHMMQMIKQDMNGVVDLMRWEILYNEGGLVIDADSICLRPLDDRLLDCEAFACWESEISCPGLIAADFVACAAHNPFIGQLILDIQNESSVVEDLAWVTVGAHRLTKNYRAYQYHALNILPSHSFMPEHYSGLTYYNGPGIIYGQRDWRNISRSYDDPLLKLSGAASRTGDSPSLRPLPDYDSHELRTWAGVMARFY